MQSPTTTSVSTTPRQRNPNHGPALTRVNASLASKPTQPVLIKDFHLDTFFNPLWMSGPHVFSFSKGGTVVRPKTYSMEPFPGYSDRNTISSLRRNVRGAGDAPSRPTLSLFPRTNIPKALGRGDKPWKNVNITEQDGIESAIKEAEAKQRALAEAKAGLLGLVYTWPPKPQPAACAECKVLAAPRRKEVGPVGRMRPMSQLSASTAGTGTRGSMVPALSNGSSGESEPESEMLTVVPERRATGQRKDAAAEKSVGFERIPRKVPPQFVPSGGESWGEWTHSGAPRETGNGDEIMNPLIAEPWVESELTIKLREILRIADI